MEVGQHISELLSPVQHLALWQEAWCAIQDLFQRFAIYVVHHQIVVAALTEVIIDSRQVRMVKRGQYGRLLLEQLLGLHPFCRRGSGIRHHLLNGHLPAGQARILGQVDRPHAADAQSSDDTVPAL